MPATATSVPPLAAVPVPTSTIRLQLSENSPLRSPGFGTTRRRTSIAANSLNASGMGECLYDSSRRTRSTGKERDAETGLDFFGARYMSSAQGRFTSPDTTGPDLANPQTFNKYRYALNNPLRYIDPNGRYEEDVHRDLTYVLALATGIYSRTAARIAQGDQGVDDNPGTSPMWLVPCCKPEEIRRDYHFTSAERRSQLYASFEQTGLAEDLGVFLHAEQDSYSHAGFNADWGHASAGHAPDKTYTDPAKADRMAKDTYETLLGASAQFTRTGAAVDWKRISPFVQRFNRAMNANDKSKALSELESAIWGARSEALRREAERRRTRACQAENASCGEQ